MKILKLKDLQGNGAAYELCLPDAMERWTVQSLRDYLRLPQAEAKRAGFLAAPPDPFRHETLRRLVSFSASAFHRPVVFVQHGIQLDEFGEMDTSAEYTEIEMERDDSTSRGNPRALLLADCNRRAFVGCAGAVVRCVDALFGFDSYPVHARSGSRIKTFAELIEDFSGTLDETHQLRVLFRLAEVVHAQPFENIFKTMANVSFCSGWEMWPRMEQGGGGICAEKTAALKFVCDVLGVATFYVAGSPYTIPEDYELQLKRYVMAEGAEEQPIWIEHLLLGFTIGGKEYLTDVSNGNLPLLFLTGEDLRRYLQAGYRGRMVYSVEHMNLKRISTWAGDALLTLCEFHVPGLHFQYIFDQALGLHISSKAYIGAFFDYGGIRTARYQGHYTALAEELRLPRPRFIHEGNMQSLPDEALQKTLMQVLERLREQYADPHYTGDFMFVIQPLNRGRVRPRISRDIVMEVS